MPNKSKVALVTGGCDEIGKACVDLFATHGARVVVLDSKENIEKMMQAEKGMGEVYYVHCDLREEKEIETAVQKALAKYGRLDYLIIYISVCIIHCKMPFFQVKHKCALDDTKVEEFQTFLQQTVVSYMTTAKYCLPHLRETKGNIVNFSSISADLGLKGCVTDTAARGAVVSFTKALALDEGVHGVRVNCISLGSIDFALLHEAAGKIPMKYFEDISVLSRLGRPEEVAKACLFLATDATFCTGTELKCCGGASIGIGLKHVKDFPYV